VCVFVCLCVCVCVCVSLLLALLCCVVIVSTEYNGFNRNTSGSVRSCHHCLTVHLRPDILNVPSSSMDSLPTDIFHCAVLNRPLLTESNVHFNDISNGNDMVVASSCSQVCGRLDACFQRYCATNAHKVNCVHDNRCPDDIDDEVQAIFSLQDASKCTATLSCQRSVCSSADIVTFNCSSQSNQKRQEVGRHISMSSRQRPCLNLYKMRVSSYLYE